jgi:hypothetical protein
MVGADMRQPGVVSASAIRAFSNWASVRRRVTFFSEIRDCSRKPRISCSWLQGIPLLSRQAAALAADTRSLSLTAERFVRPDACAQDAEPAHEDSSLKNPWPSASTLQLFLPRLTHRLLPTWD